MLKGQRTHKRQDDIIYGYLWGCEVYYYIPNFKGLSVTDMMVDLPFSEPHIRKSLNRLEGEGMVVKSRRGGSGVPTNVYRSIPVSKEWLNEGKMELRLSE